MEEMSQLGTAMMIVVLAMVLLVSGKLSIEYRSLDSFDTPAVAAVTLITVRRGAITMAIRSSAFLLANQPCSLSFSIKLRRARSFDPAFLLASQLPEETEDALAVLRLATQLVTGFLTEPEPAQKPGAHCASASALKSQKGTPPGSK